MPMMPSITAAMAAPMARITPSKVQTNIPSVIFSPPGSFIQNSNKALLRTAHKLPHRRPPRSPLSFLLGPLSFLRVGGPQTAGVLLMPTADVLPQRSQVALCWIVSRRQRDQLSAPLHDLGVYHDWRHSVAESHCVTGLYRNSVIIQQNKRLHGTLLSSRP
jgi:hypothetical protein